MNCEFESDLTRLAFARFVATAKTYLACLRPDRSSGSAQRFCGVLGWMHIALFAAFSGLAPGTMPELRAGNLTVVICTGTGMSTVILDKDGAPVESLHEPCEWSVHAQAVAINSPSPTPAIAAFHDFQPQAAKSVAAIRQHWASQNRPRGPPHIL